MPKYNIKEMNINNEKDYTLWKKGLNNFDGSTIFHNPDFLSYHGDKFNEHHLGIFKGETLFGIIPISFFVENNKKIAKSPYGASYGGAIFLKTLSYKESKDIIESIVEYLKIYKIDELFVTPPLEIFYSNYSDTFIFVMLEYGFKCINSDITSIVDLYKENDISKILQSSIRNKYKQALKNNLEIVQHASIDDFWILMKKTFAKHGTNPTHTIDEYKNLNQKFKKHFYCDIVYFKNKPIASIGYVQVNSIAKMSFYHVQDDEFKNMHGLILLINNAFKECVDNKIRYYDFGTSSVGMKARTNIFEYKEGFGATGKFRHTYKLDICYDD